MDKRIKIVLVVVVFLGILSGIFLFFAKKQAPIAEAPKTIQATSEVKTLTPAATSQDKSLQSPEAQTPTKSAQSAQIAEKKMALKAQWSQCKAKTLPADTNLFWSVQITEGIPAGGTYAKGSLNRDESFPVQVIIKKDIETADKIKASLVVGKMVFLRGTCAGLAADGSVVLQAF